MQLGRCCGFILKPLKNTQKPPKTTKVKNAPKQSWIFVVILLLLSIRHCFLTETDDSNYRPAWRSQQLIYAKLLDNGLARAPLTTKDMELTPASSCLGLARLMITLLLAGDIEVNPGPQPATPTELAQPTPLAQHATIANSSHPASFFSLVMPWPCHGELWEVWGSYPAAWPVPGPPSGSVPTLLNRLMLPAPVRLTMRLATAAEPPVFPRSWVMGLQSGVAAPEARATAPALDGRLWTAAEQLDGLIPGPQTGGGLPCFPAVAMAAGSRPQPTQLDASLSGLQTNGGPPAGSVAATITATAPPAGRRLQRTA